MVDTIAEHMENGTDVPKKLDKEFNKVNAEYDSVDVKLEALLAEERMEINDTSGIGDLYPDGGSGGFKTRAEMFGNTDNELWIDKEGRSVHVIPKGKSVATTVSTVRDSGEYKGLSLGGMLRAAVLGPQNNIERRALAEGTDSTGGFTTPTNLLPQVIDKLRAKSVAFKAGAKTVVLNSDSTRIAKLSTDATVSWTPENATISDADPAFSAITFVPKKMTALIKISRELLEDSSNIKNSLEQAFTGAIAAELDRAILLGSGASNQPTGITLTTGVNSVSLGVNGAAITSYDEIIDGIKLIRDDNFGGDMSGIVMAPRTWQTIAKFADTTNQPLRKPAAIEKIPMYTTSNMPINETQGTASDASTIIVGDFSQVLVGIRSSLRIEVLKDLYSANYQYGFLAVMRVDIALAHPQAFTKIIGITP